MACVSELGRLPDVNQTDVVTRFARNALLKNATHCLVPAGEGASTDVYDARVDNVDWEGRVYLTNVQSRRPPTIAPNWRTTSRLSSPSLVALIEVNSWGEALQETDQIAWAEIVKHSRSESGEPEFKFREVGKLCLSPISVDSNTPQELDLAKGSFVVVIDFKTFVPELIPVVSVLSSLLNGAHILPFDNGSLLGLGPPPQQKIKFQDVAQIMKDHDGFEDVLNFVFEESSLRPIMDIRASGKLGGLVNRVKALLQQVTLDGGQLKAFLNSMLLPVHCVQGPPGTGKSYLGVALARAYLILREEWRAAVPSVGSPPLLVLSYKNHAINEFLEDLMNMTSSSIDLIRIGGGFSDTLAPYSMNSRMRESHFVQKNRKKLSKLHKLKLNCRKLRIAVREMRVNLEVFRDKGELEWLKGSLDDLYLMVVMSVFLNVKESMLSRPPREEEEQEELDEATYQNFLAIMMNEDQSTNPTSCESMFPDLYDEVRHIEEHLDSKGALIRWMFDYIPPPLCSHIFLCQANFRE